MEEATGQVTHTTKKMRLDVRLSSFLPSLYIQVAQILF